MDRRGGLRLSLCPYHSVRTGGRGGRVRDGGVLEGRRPAHTARDTGVSEQFYGQTRVRGRGLVGVQMTSLPTREGRTGGGDGRRGPRSPT